VPLQLQVYGTTCTDLVPVGAFDLDQMALFWHTYCCCGLFVVLIYCERKILFYDWKNRADSGLRGFVTVKIRGAGSCER